MQIPESCFDGRGNKVLLLVEKNKGQSKLMHGLKSSDNTLLTLDGDIRRRAAEFYADLYSSEYTEDEEFQ